VADSFNLMDVFAVAYVNSTVSVLLIGKSGKLHVEKLLIWSATDSEPPHHAYPLFLKTWRTLCIVK